MNKQSSIKIYVFMVRQAVVACKPVLECHHVAGQFDYLLKVLVADMQELEYFISHTLTLKNMIGVQSSNSIISLSSLKENINL